MNILVTGGNGQLGREIKKQLGKAHQLIMTDVQDMNITDCAQVKEMFSRVKPDAVINCAAYTNVDGAETDFDGAYKVNVVGPQNLAAQCLETGARMVYVSTDYVFDGAGAKRYREYDCTNPQSVYGKTKLLGEEITRQILGRHYIVRTAWLYGDGNNFVRTMLKLAETNDTLKVVNDQIGTPTSTVDLAKVIAELLNTDAYGTYHATCQGHCSWYEFACEIFRLTGKTVQVLPVTTDEFPRPAKRPAYSVLDNYLLRMTGRDTMRNWQEALREYIASL
ncbi:dTDP-4-dehydrorhamnose reductase [bioreactor metagenome]|uniref:dTDP-4-dehydrorhamnose reductase n=1 Tax=bioreactor metagenome TaxID=1076179 RepID=A0A644YQ63_9ZZZZ